jgi:probable phosphoglycerate mutase
MTTFYLIRHGHTAAIDHFLAGRAAGTNLTPEGAAQAGRLVDELRGIALAAVVSSPLERARETAAGLARDHGVDVEIDAAFNEIDYGAWTGATFDAIAAVGGWTRYNTMRAVAGPEGGELMVEVQARAIRGLMRLHERYADRHVAVVSHGDVIRALLMLLLGMPLDFVHRLDVSPASVSVVEISDTAVRVLQVNGNTVRRPA